MMPRVNWTSEQWYYFGVLGVILVVWPGIVYLYGGNASTVIYWLTALVVLAYTVETHGLRREMVRQNEIAVQPVVIVLVETRQLSDGRHGPQVLLRNIGRGPALFLKIPDVPLADPIGEVQFVAHFEPRDLLEAGQDAEVRASMTFDTHVADPAPAYLDFVASLNPRTARDTYKVTILYENIDGCAYESLVQMGKGGIRLLRHSRGPSAPAGSPEARR
jgi:hypothetical protein